MGEIGDFFVETNNLLVKSFTGHSALSTEDEKDRFSGLFGRRLRRGIAV